MKKLTSTVGDREITHDLTSPTKSGIQRVRHPRSSEHVVTRPKALTALKKSVNQCLTSLPLTVDVATLAQLYNSPLASHIAREELLEQARTALMKYELAEADLEIAADSLARSMHLLLEQHGIKELLPEHMAELERHVLNWYGLCQPETTEDILPSAGDANDGEAKTLSEVTIRRPETANIPNQNHHVHGSAHSN